MFPSYFIIDDFFDNPMEVRRIALSMTYAPPDPQHNYPGRMSPKPMLWPNIDQMFASFVSEPVAGNADKLHGHFRITYESDRSGSDIHIDTDNVWAGVPYLTLPEHCQGGTEFYRRRKFGTDHAPKRDQDLKIYKATNQLDAMKKVFADRGKDRDKWERTNGTTP